MHSKDGDCVYHEQTSNSFKCGSVPDNLIYKFTSTPNTCDMQWKSRAFKYTSLNSNKSPTQPCFISAAIGYMERANYTLRREDRKETNHSLFV